MGTMGTGSEGGDSDEVVAVRLEMDGHRGWQMDSRFFCGAKKVACRVCRSNLRIFVKKTSQLGHQTTRFGEAYSKSQERTISPREQRTLQNTAAGPTAGILEHS